MKLFYTDLKGVTFKKQQTCLHFTEGETFCKDSEEMLQFGVEHTHTHNRELKAVVSNIDITLVMTRSGNSSLVM